MLDGRWGQPSTALWLHAAWYTLEIAYRALPIMVVTGVGRKDTEDGTNAKFLTKERALLTSENTYLETYEELFFSKCREGTLSSFCYAFTAANTFSEDEKMHTLRVNMGDFL